MTRGEDDVFVGGFRGHALDPQLEQGKTVIGVSVRKIFEAIVLPVTVRIIAGLTIRVVDAKVLDLPGVVEAVAGVGLEVVDINVDDIETEGVDESLEGALHGGWRILIHDARGSQAARIDGGDGAGEDGPGDRRTAQGQD